MKMILRFREEQQMELNLYLADVEPKALQHQQATILALAQKQGLQLEQTLGPIADFKQLPEQLSLVEDELGCQPDYQLKLQFPTPFYPLSLLRAIKITNLC